VTTVVCSASDSSGSTNTCTFTVTVLDKEAPLFVGCPVNQTNYALHGASTATAVWTSPSAMDNCDGTVPVVCAPPSGSVFPEGVTTVTCVANDSSGNTNSCTFTVSVVKVEDPRIVDFKAIGTNLVISFTTMHAGEYSIQAVGSPAGAWTNVMTQIPGSGGNVTVTNFGGAAFPPRFFRVKLSLP
jgi:hypothetical protein